MQSNQPIRWKKIRNAVFIGISPVLLALFLLGIGVYLSSDCDRYRGFCNWASKVLFREG